MYSVSYLFLLSTNVIGVGMMLFFGVGNSHPIGQNQQCGESGSASVNCVQKLGSELEEQFREENGGLQYLYLQKFRIGNKTTYAGSVTHIFNSCTEELVMDYDSERFPQYLIHSVCKDSPTCSTMPHVLHVLRLNPSECDAQGQEIYEPHPPVFLSICINKV